MNKNLFLYFCIVLVLGCQTKPKLKSERNADIAKISELNQLFESYHTEYLYLNPISATFEGDTNHNAELTIEFTDEFRNKYRQFLTNYLNKLHQFNRNALSLNDQLSYDVFEDQLKTSLEDLTYTSNLIPTNQFYGMHQTMVLLGAGTGAQPFNTVQDYNNWIKRATLFKDWVDSAIIYFNKGIASNYVLPKILVEKMIPQFESVAQKKDIRSDFYKPINKMPKNFSAGQKKKIMRLFVSLINDSLIPAYRKMAEYLKTVYLPAARTTSGIIALPNGDNYYKFLVRQNTTTTKTPQEIYEIGLKEVARINQLMTELRPQFKFKKDSGDLKDFFKYLNTKDPKNKPFKTAKEVLKAFENIQKIIEPHIKNYFSILPKSPFEIRRTESFREKSASAEYQQGSPDGTRPGVFYVPIPDAKNFTLTSGMQSLFLHEAIPGHHFQISIQQEDTVLPKFRRFGGYNAFAEGWALYCESIGKDFGCYNDPYQYMGALGDEMHRAIRLVVDVAIHTGKMTREDAIKYMTDNEPISEDGATAEIERYMVIPGQALGYKIGALKMQELKQKYQKQLGANFSIIQFHDNILKGGCLPLTILENKMDLWAKSVQQSTTPVQK